jgi:hypothetical protein
MTLIAVDIERPVDKLKTKPAVLGSYAEAVERHS